MISKKLFHTSKKKKKKKYIYIYILNFIDVLYHKSWVLEVVMIVLISDYLFFLYDK